MPTIGHTVLAIPGYPPYQGRYRDVAPHLTLDRRSATVTPESVRDRLADHVPVTTRAERIDLQWWANHDCQRLASWAPGGRA